MNLNFSNNPASTIATKSFQVLENDQCLGLNMSEENFTQNTIMNRNEKTPKEQMHHDSNDPNFNKGKCTRRGRQEGTPFEFTASQTDNVIENPKWNNSIHQVKKKS